ncbi:hypothetical protein BDA99DRAFT_609223 [Phascolomyces articulosus]|uniref:Glutathione S-transferase n=1 Tax=Phascolomyces articulosus TaxID=60185 RepID=A0AAD5P8E0_9FUNG|nr:hypothetical protein BDA99DRAFT_609223 [Phascolomyces articulosus]
MVSTDLSHLKLYYFKFNEEITKVYIGRGENVKLFLVDTGIPHEYHQYEWEEWSKHRDEWIKDRGYTAGALPALETADGKLFGLTVPILRFLSRNLKKYYGASFEDEHFVDMISDLANDWYADFDPSVWPEDYLPREVYLKSKFPKHVSRLDRFYGIKEGPYALGSEISFADFQVYHMIREENLVGKLPTNLDAFVKAFEARPNIKEYLEGKDNAYARSGK